MSRRGFTLIELLAVIGILITLATLTAISVQKIGKDGRLVRGTNTVLNVLESARSRAILEQRPMLVVFTTAVQRSGSGATDPIVAEWTEAVVTRLEEPLIPSENNVDGTSGSTLMRQTFYDRFEPHPELQPVRLPEGIKVAGPRSDIGRDGIWGTQPEIRNGEYGRMVGVLFGTDGSLLTRLPGGGQANAAQYRSLVADLNQDGLQNAPDQSESGYITRWFHYDDLTDEPGVESAQTLAVFDDAQARQVYDPSRWRGADLAYDRNDPLKACSLMNPGQDRKVCEQSAFIQQFSERVVINRFTGRAEVRQR